MSELLTAPPAHPAALADADILRQYYTDSEYLLSPEGTLKVLSVIMCVVSSVVFLSAGGGPCALLPAGVGVCLAGAAAGALLYAGAGLRLPLLAPLPWLFTDIIVSTVTGALLLVVAVLSMTVCELRHGADYAHGPLAILGAGMATASAVITYAKVLRRWEQPRTAPASAPREQDA